MNRAAAGGGRYAPGRRPNPRRPPAAPAMPAPAMPAPAMPSPAMPSPAMPAPARRLLDDARSLPDEERAELAAALIASLDDQGGGG